MRLFIFLIFINLSFLSLFSKENYKLYYNSPAKNEIEKFSLIDKKYLLKFSGDLSVDSLNCYQLDSAIQKQPVAVGQIICSQMFSSKITNYSRTLEFNKATASINCTVNGVDFIRECFTDFNSHCFVMHFTATAKGAISIQLEANAAFKSSNIYIENNGGNIEHKGNTINVNSADELSVYFSLSSIESSAINSTSYKQLKKKHQSEFEDAYLKLFVQLTNENKQIEELYKYSRYLVLSTSFPASPVSFNTSESKINPAYYTIDSIHSINDLLVFQDVVLSKLVRVDNDAIRILPNLPSNWNAKGRAVGVQMPGGFVIDVVWHEGVIKTLVVHSHLGGNCRLQVLNDISGCKCLGMEKASGINSNPYFQMKDVVETLADEWTKDLIVYDFETAVGQVIVLAGKE